MPESVTLQLPGKIDNQGNLRLDMAQLREMLKPYSNRNITISIDVYNDGDVFIMIGWYKNYVLPKVVVSWADLGERYTPDQADEQLRKLTTVCHKADGTLSQVEDLDRAMLTKFLDEVKQFCSQNLYLNLT